MMSMTSNPVARNAYAAHAHMHLLVWFVYAYPMIWAGGAGGFFIILLAVPSIAYLLKTRLNLAARLSAAIGVLLVVCVPIGILSFGFDLDRVVSVAGNVAVWLVLAAGLDAASNVAERSRLVYGLVWVGAAQGALTCLAAVAYPQRLPLPLLASYADALPTGAASFARSDLFFEGWLGGTAFRSEGIMSNATWAGAFAALTVVTALSQLTKKRHRWYFVIAALLASVSVYYSLSRSTYLLLGAALVVGLLYVIRRQSHGLFVGLALISTAAAIAAASSVDQGIRGALDDINEGRSGSAISRGAIYDITLSYIVRLGVPIIGYGIKPKEDWLVASVATHSTYLGLTFRAGLLGVGLLIALLIHLWLQVSKDGNACGAAILTFVAGWMIVGDIDTGHLIPLFLLLCVSTNEADPKKLD